MPSDTGTSDVPVPSVPNLSFVEDLYYAWLADPSAVEEPWRRYFERLPRVPGAEPAPSAFLPHRPDGGATAPAPARSDAVFQAKVDRLVLAYREYGHLRADLDPLKLVRPAEKFSLESFGLSDADLGRACKDPEGKGDVPLGELVAHLEETY